MIVAGFAGSSSSADAGVAGAEIGSSLDSGASRRPSSISCEINSSSEIFISSSVTKFISLNGANGSEETAGWLTESA